MRWWHQTFFALIVVPTILILICIVHLWGAISFLLDVCVTSVRHIIKKLLFT